MKTFLFFDLEQTLIPDWFEDRTTLLPVMYPELQEWILNQFPFTAGLFSFAVGEADMPIFNEEIRPLIESKLHFKFDDEFIITVEQMGLWMNEWNKTPFESPNENLSTFKKFGIMHAMWRNLFTEPDTRVILLDDTVDDMVITRTTFLRSAAGNFTSNVDIKNNTLEFVNPWTIIRQ